MKKLTILLILIYLISCTSNEQGKHLFILSGQSNMAGLDLNLSFIPTIEEAFGKENIIVVKDAKGGQPIRRWYKNWKPKTGNEPKAEPDLYDSLFNKVNLAIEGQSLESVSFFWMQGERDARMKHGEVYEESLIGLYNQLTKDLQRDDIHFIIGRLSDFDMKNERYPHWTMVREVQMKVADSNARFAWIDTDDLNDGFNKQGKEIKDDLHMSVEGYKTMGKRFAKKAIELIKR